MNTRLLFVGLTVLLAAAPGFAVDHNNLDAGRPLRFEDADSIAYRERALEGGLAVVAPRRRAAGLEAQIEFLYGFALNSHVSIGIEPSVGGRAESDETGFDAGDLSLGLFHSFNREYGNTPALAVRGDLFLPTGRDSSGVAYRLRGIASKTARQYGRLHANLDLEFDPEADEEEREFLTAFTLGYSHPIGYPRRFDRTGLAEVSIQPSPQRGEGAVVSIGAGLRQQITVRSVLDLGLQSDVVGFDGARRTPLRLVAGYSTSY